MLVFSDVINNQFDLIFCDYIYENLDFSWVDRYWKHLKPNSIFIGMTDYHSAAEFKVYTQQMPDAYLVNWLTWKNEFGNFAKDRFRQCHDDIIIFSKGKDFKFYGNRVQVPKATAGSKGLNPSGRETKLATSVILDCCLTTVAKERVKKNDGHLIRWQKPQSLINRILLPFTDEGDYICDPFMGSGAVGLWCKNNNRNYFGIEYYQEVFELAKKNIYGEEMIK
jgi:DNA modification methylase